MSFGISLTAPQFEGSFEPIASMAISLESWDIDGIFFFDHLVSLGDPQRPVLELASCLGAVAAMTNRLSIGALVLRAPLRGIELNRAVIETARSIGGDRLIVGLGAGDSMSRSETRRMGLGFGSLDDRLEVLETTAVAAIETGAEVWIGGLHRRVLALACRIGGWNAWAVDAEGFRSLAMPVRRQGATVTWGGPILLAHTDDDLTRLTEARNSLPAIAGTSGTVVSALADYVRAGADHLVISVLPNQPDRWDRFATEVVPRIRDV